jgi:plasmid stability protein
MGQVLIRNVNDEALERLKARARKEKTSLEQLLRDLLHREAKPSREEIWAEIDRVRAMTEQITADSTALIRADRDNDETYR